jgi:hypothetical protein
MPSRRAMAFIPAAVGGPAAMLFPRDLRSLDLACKHKRMVRRQCRLARQHKTSGTSTVFILLGCWFRRWSVSTFAHLLAGHLPVFSRITAARYCPSYICIDKLTLTWLCLGSMYQYE